MVDVDSNEGVNPSPLDNVIPATDLLDQPHNEMRTRQISYLMARLFRVGGEAERGTYGIFKVEERMVSTGRKRYPSVPGGMMWTLLARLALGSAEASREGSYSGRISVQGEYSCPSC